MDDEEKTGENSSEGGARRNDATGRFFRPRRTPSTKNDAGMGEPTQKIILFPTEESQKLPDTTHKKEPPPIIFTQPLPKISDLPEDFFDAGELEERYNPDDEEIDFSQFLEEDDREILRSFQTEQKNLSELLKKLANKADNFADQFADTMFIDAESEDNEVIERLERLIPGTDLELEGRRVSSPPKKKDKVQKIQAPQRQKNKMNQPPPKPKPKALEIAPDALGRKLAKGLKLLRVRRNFVFLLGFLASAFTFLPEQFSGSLSFLETYPQQLFALMILLIFGILLSFDVLGKGFLHSFHLRFGMDTLGLFSGIFCLTDCLLQYNSETPRGQTPYVAIVLFQFAFLLYGEEQKRWAHRRACRVASLAKEPFLIHYEPRKWNAKSAYSKCTADVKGFTTQIQAPDGAQNFFAYLSPLLLVGGFVLSLNLADSLEDFAWGFSALLVVSTPFAGGFAYGRPAHKMSKRLDKLKSALAGWDGVAPKCQQCVVGDLDLFPVGSVDVKGSFQYNNFPEHLVLAYTASVTQVGRLACAKLFHDMMLARGKRCPNCRDVAFHEAGGITAQIGLDTVFVGGAAFTELMKVRIPEGMYVSHAIFCCINGKLAGSFSLDYHIPEMVVHSLESLQLERVKPILATRDFALTPQNLSHRFHLDTGRMDFPSVLRRYELSKNERPKEGILTGIVNRDGLEPVSDCVIGAKRLRSSVVLSLKICFAAIVLGFGLVSYLLTHQAYNSLSAENLMIFMALWFAPVWIVTDLPQRF